MASPTAPSCSTTCCRASGYPAWQPRGLRGRRPAARLAHQRECRPHRRQGDRRTARRHAVLLRRDGKVLGAGDDAATLARSASRHDGGGAVGRGACRRPVAAGNDAARGDDAAAGTHCGERQRHVLDPGSTSPSINRRTAPSSTGTRSTSATGETVRIIMPNGGIGRARPRDRRRAARRRFSAR